MVKLKIRKYGYLCIFRLTFSQSQKLILKTDLKRECPYFYSNFFKEFQSVFKKVKKNGFPIEFLKSDLAGVGSFFDNFFSFWKSKTPQNMPYFGWYHAGSLNQTVPANPLPY